MCILFLELISEQICVITASADETITGHYSESSFLPGTFLILGTALDVCCSARP